MRVEFVTRRLALFRYPNMFLHTKFSQFIWNLNFPIMCFQIGQDNLRSQNWISEFVPNRFSLLYFLISYFHKQTVTKYVLKLVFWKFQKIPLYFKGSKIWKSLEIYKGSTNSFLKNCVTNVKNLIQFFLNIWSLAKEEGA